MRFSLYLVFFVDLVFLLGLSQNACLLSVSRSDPGCPVFCLLSYSAVSLFAPGCSWPCRDSLDLSADTASPPEPALDCSGPWGGFTWPINFNPVRFKCTIAFRIITRRWFPATLFKQLLYGVIAGANPHAVLGSNHAFLDANDYHTIRVTQRRQAVIRSCLHNTVSPT